MIDFTKINNIVENMYVEIETENGSLEKGYVKDILSKKNDKNGVKVSIYNNGNSNIFIGNIVNIPTKSSIHKENFKYYNLLFSNKEIYTLIFNDTQNIYTLKIISNGKEFKAILIFTDVEMLNTFSEKNKLKDKGVISKRFTRKMPVEEYFKKIEHDFIIINGSKMISKSKFYNIEQYFLLNL